jgi:hypothetical protein
MKYSYGFNPNNEYGLDIAPSMENYNSSLLNHEDYPRKVISQDFGFMDLFSLVMIIPFWIFVYKFSYLLVLPLVPISVLVFEWVKEIAPLNQLMMYGSSFLAAYLFYKGLKYLFKSLSFIEGTLLFIPLYSLAIWGVYLLLGYYPSNKALNGTILDMEKVVVILEV